MVDEAPGSHVYNDKPPKTELDQPKPGANTRVQAPLLLALETSGAWGSVALLAKHGCLAEYSLQSNRTHSSRLLEATREVMAASRVAWSQLDAISVALGPGSFTGLRIGLSSAKGLSLALLKPLIGISSLDGLAVQGAHQPLPICALIDARKQEVFAAFYQRTALRDEPLKKDEAPDGKSDFLTRSTEKEIYRGLKRTSEFLVLTPEALCAVLRKRQRPTLLLGSGVELYHRLLEDQLGELAVLAPPQLYFARAAAIGLLAIEQYRRGEFPDPARITPIYVRPSDAVLPPGKREN